MGLFDRITSIFSANINTMLDKAEDPEKMINQALRDMQENLREAKVSVARAIRDKKQIESKYNMNKEQADKWEQKAMLALKKGDEGLAKEALKRKKEYADIAATFKNQLEQQTKMVDKLKSGLKKLEDKIEESKRKKDSLVARQKTAQAQQKIHSQMAKMSSNSVFDTFDKMEDKIESLEASASAAEEMSELSGDSLEAQFDALDADPSVDDELAALKAKMGS